MANAIITLYGDDGIPVSDEPIVRPLDAKDADGIEAQIAGFIAQYGPNASIVARNDNNTAIDDDTTEVK